MSMNPEKVKRKPDPLIGVTQLKTLGDGIFAFALTLLALDIRLPEIEPDQLAQGMLALLPKLLVFVFTFLVVAYMWYLHQQSMRHIVRTDGILISSYLLYLMFVVLMPASADILGRYPTHPLAIAPIGANAGLLCTASWIMWQHASTTGKLFDEQLEAYRIKMISRLLLFTALSYFAAIPLGFISVYLVYAIWVPLPFVFYSYMAWRSRRHQTEEQ